MSLLGPKGEQRRSGASAWRARTLTNQAQSGPIVAVASAIVATTNDLKNGMTLDLDGVLWNVVEFQHVKPGKGGAFVRTKLKNVLTGQVVERTFNAGTKVETATVAVVFSSR